MIISRRLRETNLRASCRPAPLGSGKEAGIGGLRWNRREYAGIGCIRMYHAGIVWNRQQLAVLCCNRL